jgi:Trp operon repressor
LAQPFDPATREALVARVRFYRELGLTEFYRRPIDPALLVQIETEASISQETRPEARQNLGAPGLRSETGE